MPSGRPESKPTSQPQVTPETLSINSGSGGVACDPTYIVEPQTPEAMPEPATTLEWGGIIPPAKDSPSAIPRWVDDAVATIGDMGSSANRTPRVLLPVEAPMLELDLPDDEQPLAPERAIKEVRGNGDPLTPAIVQDGGKFWKRLPLAFVAPFLGKGPVFLFVSLGAPVFIWAILMSPLGSNSRLIASLAASIFFLGLLTETFARLAQCGAENDSELPRVRLADTPGSVLLGAGTASLFMGGLLFLVPTYFIYRESLPLWMAIPVGLVPYLYWPMALTTQGLTGEVMAVFNVPRVLRGIFVAPLPYIVIAVTGFVLMVAISMGVGIVAFITGIAAGLAQPSPSIIAINGGVAFLGLSYFHGVTGYAMGRLVATHPRLGDVLVRN